VSLHHGPARPSGMIARLGVVRHERAVIAVDQIVTREVLRHPPPICSPRDGGGRCAAVEKRTMSQLAALAEFIRQKNAVDSRIAQIIGRPAQLGHAGEYIAAEIFNIALEQSASRKSIDGRFRAGPFAGCTVNIKWYTLCEGVLDMVPHDPPDYYLVLTGPLSTMASSRGTVRPWVIDQVYLFRAETLMAALAGTRAKIGIATSVRRHLWDAAEVFPTQRNSELLLTDTQKEQLSLFRAA
jgi:hypothetical protein